MSQTTDDLAKYRAARDKILTNGQSVRIDMGNGSYQQWTAADLSTLNAEIIRLEAKALNEGGTTGGTVATPRIGGLSYAVASF